MRLTSLTAAVITALTLGISANHGFAQQRLEKSNSQMPATQAARGDAMVQPLPLGQTVQGQLIRNNQQPPHALYRIQARPGQRLLITVMSDDFDTLLNVGQRFDENGQCVSNCAKNDDSDNSTNSRLTYILEGNQALVHVSEIFFRDAEATPKNFRIRAEAIPAAATLQAAMKILPVGQTMTDQLNERSAIYRDSTTSSSQHPPAQLWRIQGRPGQELFVHMSKAGEYFDPVLYAGTLQGANQFTSTSSDDDSGGNLNALLRHVQLDANGQAYVLATSRNGEHGQYSIVAEVAPIQPALTVETLRVGQSVRGRLQAGDNFIYKDDSPGHVYFDTYQIQGRPGQRVVVRMESEEFDTLLRWGIQQGDKFIEDVSNDDYEENTNAQLTITLDAEGQGRLRATSFSSIDDAPNSGTGNYTLSVTEAPVRR